MNMQMWIITSLVVLASHVTLGNNWGYKDVNGTILPAFWEDYFPKCGKTRQSPIDISEYDVTYKSLGRFKFYGYKQDDLGMKLKNVGSAAKVDITNGTAGICGGGLQDDCYELAQFHFHQGSDSSVGSEHTVDGQAYPSELHLVHYNKKYGSLANAAGREPFGLAVLGIFIEVGKKDNPVFNDLINELANIPYPGNYTVLPSIVLEDLLPKKLDDFYRYQGSLTTPPCFESVQWTVFKEPIQMSESQIDALRQLNDPNGLPMLDNFRPVQALNCRNVYCNSKRAKGRSKGKKHHHSK